MIESWRDAWLREFFVNDTYVKKLPSEIRARVFRKLQMIDDASTDSDLRVPLMQSLRAPKRPLEGFCSIGVNDRWRLIFRWTDGEARDLYLDDHSYR